MEFYRFFACLFDNWFSFDHYTSPTNIGLYLAAILAADDFGYRTTTETFARITLTVETLENLPHWHGHFYNWYDTQTLQPLPPEYVSTVDSGNLAAYLIVVKQGFEEFFTRPLFDPQMIQGLLDTIRWETGKQSAGTGGRNYDLTFSGGRVKITLWNQSNSGDNHRNGVLIVILIALLLSDT